MNLKEFGLAFKGVKYLIVVDFDLDDLNKSNNRNNIINTLRTSHNIMQFSEELYGCDNPVDATLAVQDLKSSKGIKDVNLLRVTDIMDLTRCLTV